VIRTFKQFLAYAQNLRLATLNQAQGWFKIFTPLVFGIQKFISSLKRKFCSGNRLEAFEINSRKN